MFKRMVQWAALLIEILVFSAAQHAETEKTTPAKTRRKWRTFGYYAVDDTSRLRLTVCDWLEQRGNPHACDLASSGGGATIPLGPLVIDAGGSGIHDRYHIDQGEHSLAGGSGNVSIGLALINTRALRVYPLVGAGGMGGQLTASDATPGWVSLFFTTGIGVDLRIKLLFFQVVVGLRAGYRHEFADIQLGDGPEFTPPGGPFLRFVIGL